LSHAARRDPTLNVQVIREPLGHVDPDARRVPLVADRLTLAKRRWRGRAEDGEEFGFDLAAPLKNGAAFWAMKEAVYVIAQRMEMVLEVVLIPRSAPVARLGWAIGNLHFPIEVTDDAIRVPDDPALRQLFTREEIPFSMVECVFQPFARTHGHAR
jgi:urease accessory protein